MVALREACDRHSCSATQHRQPPATGLSPSQASAARLVNGTVFPQCSAPLNWPPTQSSPEVPPQGRARPQRRRIESKKLRLRVQGFTYMALSPGDKLGPYEILAPIGKGGMGEVYRANDTKLDREVAIKVLPSALAQDPERSLDSSERRKFWRR